MLSAESLKQIDIELAKYPADQRRSAIMGALRIAQTEKGRLKRQPKYKDLSDNQNSIAAAEGK